MKNARHLFAAPAQGGNGAEKEETATQFTAVNHGPSGHSKL
jgi:hypothetical protein